MAGHSRRSGVACLVLFLGAFGLTAAVARAQCTDATVMGKVTKWEFRGHKGHVADGVPQTAERAIFRTTGVWQQMFVSAYPEGRGGLIKGDETVLDTSDFTLPGLIPYRFEASFWPFWCNPQRGNTLISDQAYLNINPAEVTANDLRYVIETISGDGYELNGHPVALFTLAHTMGTLAGLTLYQAYGHDDAFAVVVTHGGRLPYRVLTEREYLHAVKAHWEKELARESGVADEQEKEIKQQIQEVRKELTGDTLAAVLAGLNQQLAALAPMREKRAAMIQKMREQEIAPIDRYLATTPAPVLERPAIPKAPGDHRGFITEKDGGNKIVVLDASYLDKALPPQAAQVITVWWYYSPEHAGSRFFKERIEQGFPFDELKAMVDH